MPVPFSYRFVFMAILSFLLGRESFAQQRPVTSWKTELSRYGEVNIAFKKPKDLFPGKLTSLLSIDRVTEDSVFAYANEMEFSKFLSMNIPFMLIPHPYLSDLKMLNSVPADLPLAWDNYPTYSAYETLMAQFQSSYPALCHIDTLAVLPSGRRLLAARISGNVSTDECKPEFLYTSSIHGNELTGYVLMLRLIDHLLTSYGSDAGITSLLNGAEIWINPLANPDGTYHGGNQTVSGATRCNANNVDLNRNYPDPQDGPHPDGYAWQPETVAFMDFAEQHSIDMSANFHGGAEVFNFPWDTWPVLHADDDWWYLSGRKYADTIHTYAPSTYFDDLDNGVTNGYAWYEVNGGRQDYMNYYHHCREVTLEISNIKIPSSSTLPTYWNYQYRSILNYMKEVQNGVRGLVRDSVTMAPLEATVTIASHDNNNSWVSSSLPCGDYYRYLYPGTYDLTFSSPGYLTRTMNNVLVSDGSPTFLDVALLGDDGILQGNLIYDNLTGSPLSGFAIYLINNLDDTVAITMTDSLGAFSFYGVDTGAYHLQIGPGIPEGGINSIDALTILQHFVQILTLTGLKEKAADVDATNFINSTDALAVMKRFVGLLDTFPAGTWLFDLLEINIEPGVNNMIISGICTGDVNASYDP